MIHEKVSNCNSVTPKYPRHHNGWQNGCYRGGMVWKIISSLLLRDPRVGGRLIQYLSETRPIRYNKYPPKIVTLYASFQVSSKIHCISLFTRETCCRGGENSSCVYVRLIHSFQGVRNPVAKSSREGVSNFSETFKRELKKGMEEAVEDMKRHKRRWC